VGGAAACGVGNSSSQRFAVGICNHRPSKFHRRKVERWRWLKGVSAGRGGVWEEPAVEF
jgi:hypothetical protein